MGFVVMRWSGAKVEVGRGGGGGGARSGHRATGCLKKKGDVSIGPQIQCFTNLDFL